MTEIKSMLNNLGERNKQHNADRISDMIKQIDHSDPGMASNVPDSMMMSFQVDGDVQTEDWVKRQKAEIKELQVKLEASKKDYKKS